MRLDRELEDARGELETAYADLRSTNEELEIINRELQARTEEADRVNAYLRSILAGIRGAVVVGRDLEVRMWSPKARELWGLLEDEVEGIGLTELDVGLPVGTCARRSTRACRRVDPQPDPGAGAAPGAAAAG